MIISHKYKFIFLKTSKTAGTSIEIALSKFCGQDDIITPIIKKDEDLRSNLGYRGPQNYIAPYSEYEIGDWINYFFKYKFKRKREYYHHIPGKRVQKMIGEDKWDSYYKFCFERNPWDRVISQYYWRTTEPRPSINSFLKSKHFKDLIKRGKKVYTINNKIAVDKIYKFEEIQESIDRIQQRLSLPDKLILPVTKSSTRKDKRHYKNILSNEQRNYIGIMFNEEILNLGYKF